MSIKRSKPTTNSRRFYVRAVDDELSSGKRSEGTLLVSLKGHVGRSNGTVSVRHRARGVKKLFRVVDFKREKIGVAAVVASIEYDPNRSGNIALLVYKDGEKRYIIAPQGLKVGMTVASGADVEPTVGNFLPLRVIPLGTIVHNVELTPGRGGVVARGAGVGATIMSKDGGFVNLKLPSGEIHKINEDCSATVGVVGNADHKNRSFGKAGRKRHLGIRPAVRGVAMHPNAHPHGGGEGRSGIGMASPKTPWGKPTLGKKTRVRRRTNKFIVKDRRIK